MMLFFLMEINCSQKSIRETEHIAWNTTQQHLDDLLPQLTISAQFWLVNKSGLPLVFRQDGSKVTAAGQFEEHEQARSVTPLLFSFSEAEEVNLWEPACLALSLPL